MSSAPSPSVQAADASARALRLQNRAALSLAPTVLSLCGVFVLFVATRALRGTVPLPVAQVLPTLLLFAGALLRLRGLARGDAAAKSLLPGALLTHVALLAGNGLVLFAASAKEDQWVAIAAGVGLLVLGSACLVAVELVQAQMRATGFIEPQRTRAALSTAATLAFAFAALVGLNSGVEQIDARVDWSFAGATTPSSATLSVLDGSACGDAKAKPELFLFFERGSPALGEVRDYFDALTSRGLKTTTLDQAIDPKLAKDLKASKNGTVAFRCGERSETLSIGATREDAQKKIPKLDADVRERLAKVSRDPNIIYVTVGHGERSLDDAGARGGDRGGARSFKKLLESTNAKMKKLGIAEGLGNAVPDDADLVIVPSPSLPLLPEEVQALVNYAGRGGALLVLVDPALPGAQAVLPSLQPLLDVLGVGVVAGEAVNDKEFVRQSNTDADHAFLFSASFGNHKSTKTLSQARGKAALLFQGVGAVQKKPPPAADTKGEGKGELPKVTMLARTRPATWIDLDGDRVFDEAAGTDAAGQPTQPEKRGIYDVAAASEQSRGDGKETRAIVVADSDAFSDVLLTNEANAIFAYDASLWLLRDDAAVEGGVRIDEDAPIRHTRDEDTLWFYGTTLGGPVLLLIVGLLVVRRSRRRSTGTDRTPPPAGGAA